MKVVVIGASGTIGTAVADALEAGHAIVRASLHGDPPVDLGDTRSIAALFSAVEDVDAVISCAASAPLTRLSDQQFLPSLETKLFGQVNLVRVAIEHLRDEGSITLTSGRIPEATPGGAGGA
jgi:NAD(P)-dependent dehydrogenase (short-subunit alcohol dehydrogenase family)